VKILLIGFEPKSKIAYPHLAEVKGFLSKTNLTDYFYFRERGYFTEIYFSIRNLITGISFIRTGLVILDISRLAYLSAVKKYDLVVAVDNFSFLIATFFFRKVVLWSHDFVTLDQLRSRSYIQKIIRYFVSRSHDKQRKIIIQDNNRLALYKSIYIKNSISPFILPVSLYPAPCSKENSFNFDKPVLLQIGGINSFRSSSDQLLLHYQDNHNRYELVFHGYVSKEIKNSLESCQRIPFISEINLMASDVYKIVTKCDIGFLAYKACDKNFYYISSSSGQLVEFLRCGKPIIALGNTDLKNLIQDEKVGVFIDNIKQLNDAVIEIKENYSFLSKNCLKLFHRKYNLENYLIDLNVWLNAV
jgi:glycosyltransferase involved in cell wall biosynthesis